MLSYRYAFLPVLVPPSRRLSTIKYAGIVVQNTALATGPRHKLPYTWRPEASYRRHFIVLSSRRCLLLEDLEHPGSFPDLRRRSFTSSSGSMQAGGWTSGLLRRLGRFSVMAMASFFGILVSLQRNAMPCNAHPRHI